jgi:hypothetical protein
MQGKGDRDEGDDDGWDLDKESPGNIALIANLCQEVRKTKTDHRQPMVSDRKPPSGAPVADPDA